MNCSQLVGRLVRDPEIKYSQGQNSICIASFTIAVDRRFKRDGEPTADFINCKAFGKQGEFVEKYFSKGKRIGLVGRIQTGSYTNKDGNKVYYTEVICDQVEFVDNKGDSGNGGGQTQQTAAAKPDDGFMNIPDGIDEELPFN